MAETTKIINRLPVKTWHFLGVNEAKLNWDDAQELCLPELTLCAQRGENKSIILPKCEEKAAYLVQKLSLCAEEGSRLTVYLPMHTETKLAVLTEITSGKDALVEYVQLQDAAEESLIYNEIHGVCENNGRIELVQVYPGKGDMYADTRIELRGDVSSFRSDIGYIAQNTQKVDLNTVVDHYGKKTLSDMSVSGSLDDAAKKIFRGTIDFKNGSSEAVGNEMENVLLLGDEVSNKTVPIILCAEEFVEGNHGATIGELDADTLFYFESRGIPRAEAEKIMARSYIERVKNRIADESFREQAQSVIEGVLR